MKGGPDSASGVQASLGAVARSDGLNTASLASATGFHRHREVAPCRKNAVSRVELISHHDWINRNVAVLFGDGSAAVSSSTDKGRLSRHVLVATRGAAILRVRGIGCGLPTGTYLAHPLDFDGQVLHARVRG